MTWSTSKWISFSGNTVKCEWQLLKIYSQVVHEHTTGGAGSVLLQGSFQWQIITLDYCLCIKQIEIKLLNKRSLHPAQQFFALKLIIDHLLKEKLWIGIFCGFCKASFKIWKALSAPSVHTRKQMDACGGQMKMQQEGVFYFICVAAMFKWSNILVWGHFCMGWADIVQHLALKG